MTRLAGLVYGVAFSAMAIFGLSAGVADPVLAQTILAQEPPIVQAIQAGDLPRVKTLVIQGENPSMTNFDGMNGISIAARNGDYDMIDYLLQVDVRVNEADKIGNNALFWISEDGDYDMAVYLMDVGADVNATNGRGLTPIMVAARNGYLDLVELYLDRQADLTIRDYTGRSVLDWSRDSRTPGLENTLINAGAQ